MRESQDDDQAYIDTILDAVDRPGSAIPSEAKPYIEQLLETYAELGKRMELYQTRRESIRAVLGYLSKRPPSA